MTVFLTTDNSDTLSKKNYHIMRKSLIIAILLAFSAVLNAQILLYQDFSTPIWPPSGWTISGNQTNWALSQSNNAGGVMNEGNTKSDPAFNGTLRFISPASNTSGMSQVIIQFKHMFDHSDGTSIAFTLSVATRASSGGTWNTVWTQSATDDIPAETVTVLVNNSDVGSGTFQFCLCVNGISYTFDDWFFDDITLLNPLPSDVSMVSIDVPILIAGNQAVKGKIVNLGETVINSAYINWSLDSGDIHTTVLSGLSITTGNDYAFMCTDSLTTQPGIYLLKVWASRLNGNTSPDDNPANDSIIQSVTVTDQIVYRRPMYEEFTSSTCNPCASFNSSTLNPFLADHDDEMTLVKYPMNWPVPGDPYYCADAEMRRLYYNVQGVPDLWVDGEVTGLTNTYLNNTFNASKEKLSFFEIQSQHEIQGNNVYIDCNILPLVNDNDITAQIAIIERITTGNVGTNGETEFHNVLMKMVPDGLGTLVSLTANQPYNMKFTADMASTNVEEMEDLMVAVFLQASDKEIYTSAYSSETGSMIISMTPANGSSNVPVNTPIVVTYHQPVRMMNGSTITSSNLPTVLTLKENNSTGANIGFTATINEDKTIITVTPDPVLNNNQQYYFRIDTLENNDGIHTFAQTSTFSTELITSSTNDLKVNTIIIYPNPASDKIYIKSNNISKISRIEILNIIGKTVHQMDNPVSVLNEISLKVADLPAGIYLIRVLSNGNVQSMRFLISR